MSTTGLLDSLYKERCGKEIEHPTQYFGLVGTTGVGILTVSSVWADALPPIAVFVVSNPIPATLRHPPEKHKLDYNHEHIIGCSHCAQKYLLVWDDKEWNYVKDWIHLAEPPFEKSYVKHGDIGVPMSLKVR